MADEFLVRDRGRRRRLSGSAMRPGDVVSYRSICDVEEASLQRGMNYRLHGTNTVILMSRRRNAPYSDRIEDEGRTLIYEGHDIKQSEGGPDPKTVDQPSGTPSGTLTQNGLFLKAATEFKKGKREPEPVRVYEKIHTGIWVYNGTFRLVDAWPEPSEGRQVYKFRLEVTEETSESKTPEPDLERTRMIPTSVKLEVWKRDKGRCVKCGSTNNLHFDHVIPFSMGGSSLVAKNIQLLCARHNLAKRDRIE